MTFDSNALDRHITGNYGEDQFKEERVCDLLAHDLVYLGRDQGVEVYQCRGCADIFDKAPEPKPTDLPVEELSDLGDENYLDDSTEGFSSIH